MQSPRPLPIDLQIDRAVSSRPLADASASRIVKRYARRRVGLDVAAYSGHSLRSGFLTSAAESGVRIPMKPPGYTERFPRTVPI